MATTYDKASLVMIPSGYKDDKLYSVKPTDGSGDFTFSRDGSGASPATRVNASGLIEKGRTNELTYSNTFSNAVWNKVGVTLTTGQADPFGGNNATKVDFAAGVNSYLFQGLLGSTNVRTRSIWMRADSNIEVSFSDGITANPINITTSWVRYEAFKVNSLSSGIQIDNYFSLTTPQQAISVYIYAAQVEDGLVATDYIETTTAAVSAGLLGDMPRLDYTGGATCPSLLLEPSRVNVVPRSEWSTSLVNLNYELVESPEGINNALRLIENTATGQHFAEFNAAIVSGTTYAISFFIKEGSYNNVSIPFQGSKMTATINIDFDAETATASGGDVVANTSFMEPYANGWYRVGFNGIPHANGNMDIYVAVGPNGVGGYTGDGVSYTDFYGFQCEAASYPTSYIPTYGSASTRGVDSCSNTSASSLIGQTQGTLFLEAEAQSGFKTFSICDGTTSNRITIVHEPPVSFRVIPVYGGVVGTQLSTSYTSGNIKIAVTYSGGNYSMFVNGAKINSASLGTFSSTLNKIEFAQGNGGNPFAGDARQTLVFPTALTDQEAIDLTTI